MINQAFRRQNEEISSRFLEHRRKWEEQQRRVDPANATFARYLEATFNTNLPAYPIEGSPFNQIQHYNSVIYLGIRALMDAMWGASIHLERHRKKGTKGIAAPGARRTDMDYVPYTGHILLDILRKPNDVDSWPMFLCKIILQYHLTGRVYIWGRANSVGKPQRMYVIPTALVTPAYGIANDLYPKGAWRVMQFYPASGLMGILPGPLAGTAGAVIDNREFTIIQNPHPLYNWTPKSPTQAASVATDLLEMIDKSCWSVMNNGVLASGVFDMPGATKEVIEATQTTINQKHAGVDNHGGIIVLGGGDSTRTAGKFSSTVPTADVMGFTSEWERVAGFVLATVCGIDLNIVGLKSSGSYADRWAGIQEVRIRKYEPFLGMVAEAFTNGPVKDWGLQQKGVRCAIYLPSMADPTIIEQRCQASATDGTMTLNEIKAARGQETIGPEGDVPVPIYLAKMQAEMGQGDGTEQPVMTSQDQSGGIDVTSGTPSPTINPSSDGVPYPRSKDGDETLPPRNAERQKAYGKLEDFEVKPKKVVLPKKEARKILRELTKRVLA